MIIQDYPELTHILFYFMTSIQLQTELHHSEYTTVYQAQSNGKQLIVKILKEQFPSLKQIARFNEEYDITNRFDVQGTRKAISKQKINDRYALVLEYVEGKTLKEFIAENQENKTNISLVDFFDIALSITHTLSKIHDNQVIHKDINPRNILVASDNTTHIIDFGISEVIKKTSAKTKY